MFADGCKWLAGAPTSWSKSYWGHDFDVRWPCSTTRSPARSSVKGKNAATPVLQKRHSHWTARQLSLANSRRFAVLTLRRAKYRNCKRPTFIFRGWQPHQITSLSLQRAFTPPCGFSMRRQAQ